MSHSSIDEIARARRVSDMLVTGHQCLRRKYERLYIFTDVVIFICSIILCILAFYDPEKLVGIDYRSRLAIGIFSIFTLVLTYLANHYNWRIRAEKHAYSAEKYFEFKKECDNNSDKINNGDAEIIAKINEKYKAISASTEKIPDKDFLKIKKKHKLKILMSKHLDEHPSTSLILLRIKLWFRDNFR